MILSMILITGVRDTLFILQYDLMKLVDTVATVFIVDYLGKCKRLVRMVSDAENANTIINYGRRGGIGHRFVSVMYSLSYAILLKRNFLSCV